MSWRRGQRYSQDLRERVLGAVDGGMTAYAAAEVFRVSVSYIYKALTRRRQTGDSGPNPNRGHRPRKLLPLQEQALAERIRAEPDITLQKLQEWLLEEHGVRLSNGAMWSAVDRLDLTFKKKPERRRAGAAGRRGQATPMAGRSAVH